MKTNTDWIEPDKIYHIYNRSINNEKLFKIESNYSHFLKNYSKYIELIADTYAYCLLENHFHFCIKTLDEKIIRENLLNFEKEKFKIKYNKEVDFETLTKMKQKIENRSVSWHISNVFASFFKSYTQTINYTFKRTGSLFENSFRRKEIDSNAYFIELIYYIHKNPQKHNLIQDFKKYPHSSYNSLLSTAPTKLKRDEVLNWFGNRDEFEKFHVGNQKLEYLANFEIE